MQTYLFLLRLSPDVAVGDPGMSPSVDETARWLERHQTDAPADNWVLFSVTAADDLDHAWIVGAIPVERVPRETAGPDALGACGPGFTVVPRVCTFPAPAVYTRTGIAYLRSAQ